MTLEQTLFNALAGGSPAPTDAGDRVYPVLLPEDPTYPAVTYQRVVLSPTVTLDGDSGLDNVRVQIDCWAESYLDGRALATQVRNVMQTIAALPVSDLDDRDPETGVFRVIMEFSMWDRR